jgi:hypothetical protein
VHLSRGGSRTTSQRRGGEEAVMARRAPHTTKALEVRVMGAPSRLRPACVAQAYEEVVPLTQRTPARAAHMDRARREETRPPVSRRAAS